MKSLFNTKLILLGTIAVTSVLSQIATEGLVVSSDTVISFEGVTGTKPRNFIGIKGRNLVVDDLKYKDDTYSMTHTFNVVAGTCDEADSISIMTFNGTDKSKYYVVPNGKDMSLMDEGFMFSEKFKKMACFRKHPGLSQSSALSIESISMPL